MSLHVFKDMVQRSDEWYEQRCGMVTASAVGKLLTVSSRAAEDYDCPACEATAGAPCISLNRKEPTPISAPHKARVEAAAEASETASPVIEVADNETSRGVTLSLVAERIAGITDDGLMTSDMWRGVEAEPVARAAYAKHLAPVTEVGFMVRDDWGFSIGYSPDGLVGDDGLIEIKAPRAKNHVATVLAGDVPAYNMAQLQTGLLVSGRRWIDFIPYVAGLPLWVKRVTPNPAWHRAIVAAVAQFETTAAEMVAAYSKQTEGLVVTEPPTQLEMVI